MRKLTAIYLAAVAVALLCAAEVSAARVNRVNVKVVNVNRPAAVNVARVNVVNVAAVNVGHAHHFAAFRSFGYGYAAPLQLAAPVYGLAGHGSCGVQSVRQEVVTTKEEIVEVPQPAIQQRTVTTIRRSIVSP